MIILEHSDRCRIFGVPGRVGCAWARVCLGTSRLVASLSAELLHGNDHDDHDCRNDQQDFEHLRCAHGPVKHFFLLLDIVRVVFLVFVVHWNPSRVLVYHKFPGKSAAFRFLPRGQTTHFSCRSFLVLITWLPDFPFLVISHVIICPNV